jgi:hypothetical protein
MDTAQNDSEASLTPMSLPSRLMNVYVAPGEVFDLVRSGNTSVFNWLVPMLLCCAVGIAAFFLALSQPVIQQQLDDMQTQAIQKMVDQQKITAAQAEQSKAVVRMVTRIAAPISMVIMMFLWFFAQSLGLWLMGTKLLKAHFTFGQTMNLVGLATMIIVLGHLANTLIAVGKGNMFMNLGASLFLPGINIENRWHQVIYVVTLPKLWYFTVLALGWSKLCSLSWAKALAIVFGLWLTLRVIALFMGWGTVTL